MTENQKLITAAFHSQGLGYKAITKKLGVSVNSVKSYCKTKDYQAQMAKAHVVYDSNYCPIYVKEFSSRREK